MNAGTVDRIPPQNLEAEMALLGSILVDREMMATVAEIIEPSDFYAAMHETIYTALLALYERGEPLDKITLSEELKRRGQLEKIGGLAYLTSLMDTVPTAASAEYYANIVREKSSLRGLIHAGTQITRIGYEGEEDVEGSLDRSEQIVYEVGRRQMHGKFTPVSQMLKPVFDNLDQLFSQRGDRTGITSGFRDIDEHTAGFQPGNLIILAARPGMGKTSLALTMAAEAARVDGKPVAFFSLEMTNEELVQRMLASAARLDSQKLKRGNIHDNEWTMLSEAMSQLSNMHVLGRFCFGDGDGDSQSRAPSQSFFQRPWNYFHRLLAARAARTDGKERQSQRRDLGDLPHAQSYGQRSRGSDRRPRTAESCRRGSSRQTPDAFGYS